MRELPELDTDLVTLWPRFGVFEAALRRRDWPAARDVLAVAGPVERTRLLVQVVEVDDDREGFLRGLVREHPDDGAVFVLLAGHLHRAVWRAWEADPVGQFDRARLAMLERGINRAEEVLLEGAARHPDDPAIWTMRLVTGHLLGRDELARRYERAAAIDPDHLPAQLEWLRHLGPEQGGISGEAPAFARERMLAAPPGSGEAALVARTMIHQFDELEGEDLEKYVAEALPVLHEAAERSVWHREFEPGDYDADLLLGEFAVAFYQFGDRRATARIFRRMNSRAALRPWTDFTPGAAATLDAAYRWAFEGAG